MANNFEMTYSNELNDFCRKYIIIGERPLTMEDKVNFPKKYDEIKQSIFEDLLLFDAVNYKVHGENIALAILIHEIGLSGVEDLIEKGALNFTLWTSMIGVFQDNLDGVDPLVTGRFNNPVHSDPEESIIAGLNFMKNKLKRKDARNIVRKLRDNYIVLPKGIENNVKSMTMSAFDSGKLAVLGLSNQEVDIRKLSKSQKDVLVKCAGDLLEYKFLIERRINFNVSKNLGLLFSDSFDKISKLKRRDVFSVLSEVENFPNLKEVSTMIKNPLQDVVKIRNKRTSRKFRNWLTEVETSCDMKDVSKYYIDSIVNRKGFLDTFLGKTTKSVTMMSIGGLSGMALGGPVAAIAGSVGGMILSPTIDFALDMLDEYLISEVTKGWTPRMFFDHMNKIKR
ncbi:hypothetical protein KWG64_18600 [Rahnella sp. PD12R]|uniref:hypothetical protein n=1 Tax=Rahnella sp. PD12R TaxID=2855688 RepID=UPI001C450C33|nr:hypothetical protein [Rahnella sp. PD12R]MBV6819958.1 hypothetical protein [Rahnella sp. PD12R]